MRTESYHTRSYELAEHFLNDDDRVKDLDDEKKRRLFHALATVIQTVVENWIEFDLPERL